MLTETLPMIWSSQALKEDSRKIINLWECNLKPVKVKRTLTGLLKNIN
jgi:hypothetical protein